MGKAGRETADAVRLGMLLKVERSTLKTLLVTRIMGQDHATAEKIRLIHNIDDLDEGTLRQQNPEYAKLSGPQERDEIKIPPMDPPAKTAAVNKNPNQAAVPAKPGFRSPVETRDADEAFEQKSREIAKARRRLYRPLARKGWVQLMLHERIRIQEFGADTGLLRCGLLPSSLVLCPEIIRTKVGILRDTEFPGLHGVVKPLMPEVWRNLVIAQYNRLAALYRFLDFNLGYWSEYNPGAALPQQLVFFQRIWPDYLALFVLRTEPDLVIAKILAKAMKAAKANPAQIELALARLTTIEATLGGVLRAVHMVGWRRFFLLPEVAANKREELFLADTWDSNPDIRREISSWLGNYQGQYEKTAAQLREIRRIRFLLPSIPGEGVDRPDLAPLRFWCATGWDEKGLSRPVLWLFEASRHYLKGFGRLMAGTYKLADGTPCKMGNQALAGPVVAISDLAKRLLQHKPVLEEIDQARLDLVRDRPEKSIELEREVIKTADAIVGHYEELAMALMAWLSGESLAAPAELQEPAVPGRRRSGSVRETELVTDPVEIADRSLIDNLVKALRMALLIPLAMGRTGLLGKWHGAAALETQLATLQTKIKRLEGSRQD